MTTNTLTAPNLKVASKAPSDSDSYGIDWTNFLPAGDYIASVADCSVSLCAGDASGVSLSAIALNGMVTYCGVTGGTVGQTAKIEFKIKSAMVPSRTLTIELPIRPEC